MRGGEVHPNREDAHISGTRQVQRGRLCDTARNHERDKETNGDGRRGHRDNLLRSAAAHGRGVARRLQQIEDDD
jgi:hypothetical protein